MILDRAVITLEAARRVRVRTQLRELNDVLYAILFCRIDKTELLLFDLRRRRYQQKETIDSHQSARERFRLREIALDNFNAGKCNRLCVRSIANKSTGRSSALREFLISSARQCRWR
jgi:hypothetical protein